MELSCPSCGNKYLTEDYPETFEIQCSCGYSILVPEMASEIHSPSPDDKNFNSLAGAVEAQDEAMKISLNPNDLADPLLNIPKLDESLTPSTELPNEMPYDPYEVNNLESNNREKTLANFDLSVNDAPTAEDFSNENNLIKEENLSPTQKIIQRAQVASIGQLIGLSYNLQIQNLDSNQIKEIYKKCEILLETRPWLMNELKKRNINLKDALEKKELEQIPEMLALEIFMASFELGGSCTFSVL
jgi:DNA-directed RNA polymerase subunit RPC12/RpoP